MELGTNEKIYFNLMERALKDSYLSSDEGDILEIVADKLNIPETNINRIHDHFKGKRTLTIGELDRSTLGSDYRDVFKAIVRGALEDEQITREEFELIKELRKMIGITSDERQRIYNEVRREILETEADPGMITRIQNFLFR